MCSKLLYLGLNHSHYSEYAMKKLLIILGLVAYLILEYTKPDYDVSLPINKFQIILIAVGIVASLIIILWLTLSLIIWLDERRQ